MNRTLIIFARKPELGKVKSRLAKNLGEKKTFEIYCQLLDATMALANQVDAETKLYWSKKNDGSIGFVQQGIDLGERMYNTLLAEITSLAKVCLIGTDIPAMTPAIIEEAFEKLENSDIVFGPAKDGGYYLIAIKNKVYKELFLHKKWSCQKVLSNALSICKKLNLKVGLLPVLQDIDTINDYNQWQKTI